MTTHRIATALIDKNFDPTVPGGGRVFREMVRLLAGGEPVTIAQLGTATGLSLADLERVPAWPDVEFDDQGSIVGWGLSFNPTVHSFVVEGRQLYVWCAGDTLLIPALIGRTAQVESLCPATGTMVRLCVDPTAGIVSLEPVTAVIAFPALGRLRASQVRNDFCNPHRFFTDAEATRKWQGSHEDGTVLPVAEAYDKVLHPFIQRILSA